MRALTTALPGVLILEPKVFGDARGFFLEAYNRKTFSDATGTDAEFVQDNHSRSAKGVLRGMHLQTGSHAQGKLVRVSSGRVFDVAADVRRASPTFGRWVGVELDAESQRQLWIPAGYAHGFVVLSDFADFLYKATVYYAPAHEIAVRWDDPRLGIDWPDIGMDFALAARDRDAPLLDERPDIA
jgi:dTDP-4-dehydrorhamnose 3,5-epimerase